MPRLVAFLRAINVGGHSVTMPRLRDLFRGLGFLNVETFIASGNVIFDQRSKDFEKLQHQIEDRLRKSLGYEVAAFIRTEGEVGAISRFKPFKASDIEEAGAFCVGFLAAPLRADARKALMALATDIDDFHVQGREVYWLCKRKQSQSTFSNAVFEKKVKVHVTFRGVPTIVRLAAKLDEAKGGRSRA